MSKGNLKHGLSKSKIYGQWQSMIGRCKFPSHTSWKWYGAKGVVVCERWLKFENFLARYEKGWPADKILTEKKRTGLITFNGVTKHRLEWAKEFGISPGTIWLRLKMGLPLEKVFSKTNLKFTK